MHTHAHAHARTHYVCLAAASAGAFGSVIRPSTRRLGLSCPVPLPVDPSPVLGGGTGSSCAAAGPRPPGLTPPTSAPGLRSSCPHLRRDCARLAHIWAGIGARSRHTPHLHPDWAPPAHICPGTVRRRTSARARTRCPAPPRRRRAVRHRIDQSIGRARAALVRADGSAPFVQQWCVGQSQTHKHSDLVAAALASVGAGGGDGLPHWDRMVGARRTPDAHCLCADRYG